MSPAGYLIMFLSVGLVTSLFLFCIYKVLRSQSKDRLHGYEGDVPDPRRDD